MSANTNGKSTVWILTSEVNDYNQHGEYFEAVWLKKPTVKQLTEHFHGKDPKQSFGNVMAALDFILHVEKGGGRQKTEDHWYNLNEVETK